MERIGKTMQRWIAVFAAVAITVAAHAQDVSAFLSSETTAVGMPVQLTIQVTGARGASLPRTIDVDGLEIVQRGQQTEFRIQNFRQTFSTSYIYIVVPRKPGTMQIPSLSVKIEDKTLKTQPLSLHVETSSAMVPPVRRAQPVPGMPQISVPSAPPSMNPNQMPPPPQPSATPVDMNKAAYGELLGIGAKKNVYAGEVIPVEVRFYFDAEFPTQVGDRPMLTGDGFTIQEFAEPQTNRQEIDGRVYNVVNYKTALTAVKAGPLELPAAKIDARMQVPVDNANAGSDDFFGGLFRNGMFADTRDLSVETKPVHIDVKPLPKEGRPADFTGAIGQFEMDGTASPLKAESGDPVTLSLILMGRGNFEAMGAPQLNNTEGWRTYPASEKFDHSPTDPTGFFGKKTFDFTMIAREDRKQTPGATFSYFDPVAEKYQTLTFKPVNVEAKGGKAPEPAPAVADATPTPEAAVPVAKAEGLLSLYVPASFRPVAWERDFLIANGAIATAWIAVLGFFSVRRLAVSPQARLAAVKRERKQVLHKLESPSLDEREFAEKAGAFVEERFPGGVRDGTLEANGISRPSIDALQRVLDRRDEGKFSSSSRTSKLGPEERTSILTALKEFDEKVS
jgi:hypothetical protein